MTPRRRTLPRPLAAAACALVLALTLGCLSLQRDYPTVLAYALSAPEPAASATAPIQPPPTVPSGLVLKLRPIRVAQMFDGRKFVYLKAGDTWTTDFYHEFFIPPGQMMTDLVGSWLEGAKVGIATVPASSQISPTHVLEANLRQLYIDLRDPVKPRAVLAMDFLLVDQRSPATPHILLQQTFNAAVDLASSDPEAMVAGWNKCLAEILAQLKADLSTELHEDAPAAPTPIRRRPEPRE